MATNTVIPYFQSNQNITTPQGNMIPIFANKMNNIIGNLQYQLTQIENVFTELNTTNGDVADLQTSLNNFVEDIKTFTTDMEYIKNYTSYTKGITITASITEISVSAHTRYFFDGTTKDYPSTTWSLPSTDTQYYIYMDASDGTYHHSTDINDCIQTGTNFSIGTVTTPAALSTTTNTGSSAKALGQMF